jgi:hypothetical protein
MPPKLDPETRRVNMVVSAAWMKKIDEWRRQQPDLPNVSEAVRRLVELGLESPGERGGKKRVIRS